MPVVLQVSVRQATVVLHQRQLVLVHVQVLHLNVVLASNNSAFNKKTGLIAGFFTPNDDQYGDFWLSKYQRFGISQAKASGIARQKCPEHSRR
jgi:hypothetical protein